MMKVIEKNLIKTGTVFVVVGGLMVLNLITTSQAGLILVTVGIGYYYWRL
jgi:hypothetical protein